MKINLREKQWDLVTDQTESKRTGIYRLKYTWKIQGEAVQCSGKEDNYAIICPERMYGLVTGSFDFVYESFKVHSQFHILNIPIFFGPTQCIVSMSADREYLALNLQSPTFLPKLKCLQKCAFTKLGERHQSQNVPHFMISHETLE